MVKITIEIVNPISALGKKLATRKIEKINNKIEKLNNQKSKLESKFFNDSKKIDSDKVTESTKQIEQKTRTITEYTYFVNPEIITTKGKKMTGEKAHGLITLRLRAFGVLVKKFNRSKTGKKEEYIVFNGNTDEQNLKINEVFDTVKEFQNYLHRSKRGEKEVIVK